MFRCYSSSIGLHLFSLSFSFLCNETQFSSSIFLKSLKRINLLYNKKKKKSEDGSAAWFYNLHKTFLQLPADSNFFHCAKKKIYKRKLCFCFHFSLSFFFLPLQKNQFRQSSDSITRRTSKTNKPKKNRECVFCIAPTLC